MNSILSKSLSKYILVSPAKDEERYIKLTIRSVIHQTLKPILWVIVNDGSRDGTVDIVKRYLPEYPFIRLLNNPNTGRRQTGSAVIRAFNYGYRSINNIDYDFIAKLDCDLSFGPDYFEKILKRFIENKSLGISSGAYFEKTNSGFWKEVVNPSYHAAGACKVVHRKCFEDIGGFIEKAGWDTVDEIRAIARGWKTCHYKDLHLKHHKPEGSGIGMLRTNIMHGKIYYLTGGGKLFFLLKLFHRVRNKPFIISALALLWGYLKSALSRQTPLVTKQKPNAIEPC